MRTRNEDKVQLVKMEAMKMVVKCGFEGFSVNKLAKACGISVATLYIYYKDKDDLITQIGMEEARRMEKMTMLDFHGDMHFGEGLRQQWKNRAKYALENPTAMLFFDQLRSSTYHEEVIGTMLDTFKEVMSKFMINAVKNKEVRQMPVEVYWSVAFAPLYSLLRFHNEGRSIGGKEFVFSEDILWQTFDVVVKALTP